MKTPRALRTLFFYSIIISVLSACSSTAKKNKTTPAEGPALPCADVKEIKSRLNDLPELLVRLGGEHQAVRSYRKRPKDFFQEGHTTACESKCPQQFATKLNLPNAPQARHQPSTFHFTLQLLSYTEPSTFDFKLENVTESNGDLSGQQDGHNFYARAVGKDFVYVEWVQRDNNSTANSEQNVLVKILPNTDLQVRSHVSIQGKGICPE